jgi:hypothetical protein
MEVSIAAVETTGPGAAALSGSGEATGDKRLEEIRLAHPEERKILLAEFARKLIMEILRLGGKHAPSLRDRLMDLGFDSLMAVHFRNRIVSALGLTEKLPATLVFDYPTCEEIGNYLAGLLGGGDSDSVKGAPVPVDVPAGAERGEKTSREDLDLLTEGEAEAALLRRLEEIEGKTR